MLNAAGDWIPRNGSLSWVGSGANGVEQLSVTTYWETAVAVAHGPSRPIATVDAVVLAVMYLMLATTAWALKGVPSWNFTPLRRVNV